MWSYALLCVFVVALSTCDGKSYRVRTECNSFVIHDDEPVKNIETSQKIELLPQGGKVPVKQTAAAKPAGEMVTSKMPCSCAGMQCSCCAPITVRQQNFSQQGCVKFNYSPTDRLLSLRILTNNKRIYETQFKAYDPPPICVPIPQFPVISLCVQLFNIHTEGFFNVVACIRFVVKLADTPIFMFALDCFNFGPSGVSIVPLQTKQQSIFSPLTSSLKIKPAIDNAVLLEPNITVNNVPLPSTQQTVTSTSMSNTTQRPTTIADAYDVVNPERFSIDNDTTVTSFNSTFTVTQVTVEQINTNDWNVTQDSEWITQGPPGKLNIKEKDENNATAVESNSKN